MRSDELEQLLHEDEGATLDFKRDQYPFENATETQKSELLKDILGFANGFRRTVAFIVIGVEEVQGGRSNVVGVTKHLPDHSLQQFVNSLTNRTIHFGYETCEFEGKQVGVIRIELQHRPIFLKREYGKLSKGRVYIRRGSSTDPSNPAEPDEIALMGKEQTGTLPVPSLAVEFASPEKEEAIGPNIAWTAQKYQMPDDSELPQQETPAGHWPGHWDPKYYRKMAAYVRTSSLFRIVRLLVINNGTVGANNVRLEISIPQSDEIDVMQANDYPASPKRFESFTALNLTRKLPVPKQYSYADSGRLIFANQAEFWRIQFDCGDMQPGRRVWSDCFYLAANQSGHHRISGQIFASNLPAPSQFSLFINASVSESELSPTDVVNFPEQDEE